MKSLNILMMAMLMVTTGSNLLMGKAQTISNVSDEIIGVQFYDQNKKPLPLVNANINITNPGELGGSDNMNIPTTAAFVTVSYIEGIPNTTTYRILKNLVSLFKLENLKSYYIVGFDTSAGSDNITLIPWTIIDSNSYEKSALETTQNTLNANHSQNRFI